MEKILYDDLPKVFDPYDHQYKVSTESLNKNCWAFFMEAGTGKSKVCIDQVLFHYLNGHIDTFVVSAKKGEYINWAYIELPAHWPKEVPVEIFVYNGYTIRLASGRDASRSLLKTDRGRLRVLVINVESIDSELGSKLMKEVYKTSKGVFYAMDESTCVKNHKSKRTKAALAFRDKSMVRRIMTGTSVTQSPLDLWGQALFLKPGLLGFTSFTSFKGYFCEIEKQFYGDRSFDQIVGYRNIGELKETLGKFSHIILKKDCLDLPEKIYSRKIVPMTTQQEKLYAQMRDEAMLEFGDIQIEVTNVLAQITKMHQIVCGQLKVGNDEYVSIENNRLDVCQGILEELPHKAIIWAGYRQTLKDVADRVRTVFGPKSVATYFGGVSQDDRRRAIEDFQDPGSPVRFFISNPQSGGYGLTLTAAKSVIYYSNGYNLEHRLQSEDRAHRIGQDEAVNYYDLVTPNTVDERIIDILRAKKELANEILGTSIKQWI